MVSLSDLRELFQPEHLYDSMSAAPEVCSSCVSCCTHTLLAFNLLDGRGLKIGIPVVWSVLGVGEGGWC